MGQTRQIMLLRMHTLIPTSQVLQSMGNLNLEMDAKEPFMQPMSAILPTGVRRIKEFIQDLVQIDQRSSE